MERGQRRPIFPRVSQASAEEFENEPGVFLPRNCGRESGKICRLLIAPEINHCTSRRDPDPREEPATPARNRLRQQDDWKSKAPREQTIRQTERARGGERRAENKFPRCPDSIGADNDKRRYQKQRWKKGREP